MSDNIFQWSFIGASLVALALIVLGALPILPGWVIAIGVVGGIGGDIALLHYWGKDYMSRY